MQTNPTIEETLGEFDAGLFLKQLETALKEVALGVIANDKKAGSVTMDLKLKRIGESSSVTVEHTLKFNKPTRRGKSGEEMTTSTPMYVNNLGYLTIHPQTQDDLFEQETPENVTKIRSTK